MQTTTQGPPTNQVIRRNSSVFKPWKKQTRRHNTNLSTSFRSIVNKVSNLRESPSRKLLNILCDSVPERAELLSVTVPPSPNKTSRRRNNTNKKKNNNKNRNNNNRSGAQTTRQAMVVLVGKYLVVADSNFGRRGLVLDLSDTCTVVSISSTIPLSSRSRHGRVSVYNVDDEEEADRDDTSHLTGHTNSLRLFSMWGVRRRRERSVTAWQEQLGRIDRRVNIENETQPPAQIWEWQVRVKKSNTSGASELSHARVFRPSLVGGLVTFRCQDQDSRNAWVSTLRNIQEKFDAARLDELIELNGPKRALSSGQVLSRTNNTNDSPSSRLEAANIAVPKKRRMLGWKRVYSFTSTNRKNDQVTASTHTAPGVENDVSHLPRARTTFSPSTSVSIDQVGQVMDAAVSSFSLRVNASRLITLSEGQTTVLSAEQAEALLRTHNWNTDTTFDHVINAPALTSPCLSAELALCTVCFCEPALQDGAPARALGCGHAFCSECWTSYLTSKIQDGGDACLNVACMKPGCKVPVSYSWVQNLVSSEDALRFRELSRDAFIDVSKHTKRCSSETCARVIVLADQPTTMTSATLTSYLTSSSLASPRLVQCACEHVFCFDCSGDPHGSTPCSFVNTWTHAQAQALENSTAVQDPHHIRANVLAKEWILNNTKPCPKCTSIIERDRGCNHFTCPTCQHEFCWQCLGPWAEHGSTTGGFFRCHIFTQERSKISHMLRKLAQPTRSELRVLRREEREENERMAESDALFRRVKALNYRVGFFDAQQQVCVKLSNDILKMLASKNTDSKDQELFMSQLANQLRAAMSILNTSFAVSFVLNEPGRAASWFMASTVIQDQAVLSLKVTEPCALDGPHRSAIAVAQDNMRATLVHIAGLVCAPETNSIYARGLVAKSTVAKHFSAPPTTRSTQAHMYVNDAIGQLITQSEKLSAVLNAVVSLIPEGYLSTKNNTMPDVVAANVGLNMVKGCAVDQTTTTQQPEAWLCGCCHSINNTGGNMHSYSSQEEEKEEEEEEGKNSCAHCNADRVFNVFTMSRLVAHVDARQCHACRALLVHTGHGVAESMSTSCQHPAGEHATLFDTVAPVICAECGTENLRTGSGKCADELNGEELAVVAAAAGEGASTYVDAEESGYVSDEEEDVERGGDEQAEVDCEISGAESESSSGSSSESNSGSSNSSSDSDSSSDEDGERSYEDTTDGLLERLTLGARARRQHAVMPCRRASIDTRERRVGVRNNRRRREIPSHILCPVGHRTGRHMYPNGVRWHCDSCERSLVHLQPTFRCQLCNWDMCTRCVGQGRSVLADGVVVQDFSEEEGDEDCETKNADVHGGSYESIGSLRCSGSICGDDDDPSDNESSEGKQGTEKDEIEVSDRSKSLRELGLVLKRSNADSCLIPDKFSVRGNIHAGSDVGSGDEDGEEYARDYSVCDADMTENDDEHKCENEQKMIKAADVCDVTVRHSRLGNIELHEQVYGRTEAEWKEAEHKQKRNGEAEPNVGGQDRAVGDVTDIQQQVVLSWKQLWNSAMATANSFFVRGPNLPSPPLNNRTLKTQNKVMQDSQLVHMADGWTRRALLGPLQSHPVNKLTAQPHCRLADAYSEEGGKQEHLSLVIIKPTEANAASTIKYPLHAFCRIRPQFEMWWETSVSANKNRTWVSHLTIMVHMVVKAFLGVDDGVDDGNGSVAGSTNMVYEFCTVAPGCERVADIGHVSVSLPSAHEVISHVPVMGDKKTPVSHLSMRVWLELQAFSKNEDGQGVPCLCATTGVFNMACDVSGEGCDNAIDGQHLETTTTA